jgi:hypothetical protein
MEREREPVEKAPPEKEVEVRGSPTRCPYCHDECTVEQQHSVCEACLARHHESCWDSHGACATCSSTRRLAPVARPALTVDQARATLAKAGFSEAEIDAVFAGGGGSRSAFWGRKSVREVTVRFALVMASIVAAGPFISLENDRRNDQRLVLLGAVLFPLLGIVSGSSTRSVIWGLLTPVIFFLLTLLAAGQFVTRAQPECTSMIVAGLAAGLVSALIAKLAAAHSTEGS